MNILIVILVGAFLLFYVFRDSIRRWMMRKAMNRMKKMMGVPDPGEEERKERIRRQQEERTRRRRDDLRRNATHIHRHIHLTVAMMQAVAVDVEFTELTVSRIILAPDVFEPEDQIYDTPYKSIG